jgi:class 3 adenylate cyclase
VVAQVRLEAAERVELEVKLSAGDYLIRGPRLVGQQRLRVRPTPAPSTHEVAISELGKTDHTPVLRAGRQVVTLTNDLDHLQVLRIERMIARDDVVTATHASTLALFRELFPDQVLGQNRPIAADEMTLVATYLQADQLYDSLGDREAYDLIAKHLDVLRTCIASHRGTVAKTVGEGVLAAFVDCEHAVDAALAMQSALDEESELSCIRLSIGINRGRTLVATMNQRLDYFGATARAVNALPDFAAGDILMTETVFGDPEVQARLRKRGLTGSIESLHLPGRPTRRFNVSLFLETNFNMTVTTTNDADIKFTLVQVDQDVPSERRFTLHDGVCEVGRGSGCGFRINSGSVSKRHARFIASGMQLIVEDLGSTNGTFVNGKRVSHSALVDRDIVQFANATFRIERCKAVEHDGTIEEGLAQWAQTLISFDTLLSEKRVIPFYQPIITMDRSQVVGFEVLARSSLPELTNPAAMFGVAERLGQQAALSELMRSEGMRVAAAGKAQNRFYLNTHPIEVVNERMIESLVSLRATVSQHGNHD